MLALTGTADSKTQDVIISQLAMNNPTLLFISPNRNNLRITVVKSKKDQIFFYLLWLVKVIKEKSVETPKTIIFCNGTLNDIATIFNFLLLELKDMAYTPASVRNSENCIIGIYHSLTFEKYKERVMKSFKENGKKRVVIASTALCMGINFPDIRYVIHWGPPRNLLDYHQQSGRAGRDGKPANIIIFYYGQQTSFCEQNVKDFVNETGCYRIAAYKPFDNKVQSVVPAHDCCNNCAQMCRCGGDMCAVHPPLHDCKPDQTEVPQVAISRPVSEVDKQDLESGLYEVVNLICDTMRLLDLNTTPPDYIKQLVEGIMERAHVIFTVNDIVEYYPVFSIHHALKIIELFNEIFEDIPNLDTMVEVFGLEQISMPTADFSLLEHYNFEESIDDEVFVNDEDL